jgi:arginyl-tRNA synthetase
MSSCFRVAPRWPLDAARPQVIEETLRDLMLNRLTDFVYELSGKFNDFYRDCHVIGDEKQASRLLICEATARLMRQVFHLLGVRPVYKI